MRHVLADRDERGFLEKGGGGMKTLVTVLAVWFAAGMTVMARADDLGVRFGSQRLAEGGGSGAFVGGGYFRWDWHRIAMLEASVLYHSESVDSTNDVELIPVQLSGVIYPLRRDYQFSPYVLGGIGLYVTRTVTRDVDSNSNFDFGWHLGFGADYALNDRVFLEGDFRYVWLKIEGHRTLRDIMGDFDSWMATVGIGFRL
jgi:hypothetical protein